MEHRWVYVRKSSIIENQKIFRQKKTLKFGLDTLTKRTQGAAR